MSSIAEDVLGAVRTALLTITDIGNVHQRLRWANDWETYLDEFKYTPTNTIVQVRGWMVTLQENEPILGALENDGEGGFGRLGSIQRNYNVLIHAVMSFRDSTNTESDFWALLEAAMNKLDVMKNLSLSADGVQLYGVGPSSIRVNQFRQIGTVLCHYAELTYPVRTIVDLTYV